MSSENIPTVNIRFTATHPHFAHFGDHVSPNQKREVEDRFPAFPNLAFLGLCDANLTRRNCDRLNMTEIAEPSFALALFR
jgi:hypothetical protein